ncbi:MAG: hypothetical protein K6G68_11645, partial [Oscillospiraceae bacterium]|nr:hypothetical protein [Oscillospiraceae bacterium]
YYKDGKVCKGFIKTDSGYMYFDKTTYKMVTGWIKINGNSYYFGENGLMFSNGTYTIEGKKYTFGSDGVAKAIKSTTTKPKTKTQKLQLPDPENYGFTNSKFTSKSVVANMYCYTTAYGAKQLVNYETALESYGYTLVEADTTTLSGGQTAHSYAMYYNGEFCGVYSWSSDYNYSYDMYIIIIAISMS